MADKYIPRVQEASIPEEGSWIEMKSGWVLALSIPDWKGVVGRSSEGYQYMWMYDRIERAYLFCFKLSDQVEKAVAFPYDHADMFLRDQRAQGEFSVVITESSLEEDQATYLILEKVRFKRHPGEIK